MARRVANRMFWMLIGVATLLIVVGVPYLHAISKVTFTNTNVKQHEAFNDLTQDELIATSASHSSAEVRERFIAPLFDEFYSQFLHSAAVLTIAAGAILTIAFYVRYQIGAAEADSAD